MTIFPGLVAYLTSKYPALEQGEIVDNPVAVKRTEQTNGVVRMLLSLAVTAAVGFGWIPEGTDVQTVVVTLFGAYTAVSSAWGVVSNIVSTRKLGV